MANWKVNVFEMVLNQNPNYVKCFTKQILETFEINELNPKYDNINEKVKLKHPNAEWEIQAISKQAENTSLFEL